MSDFKAPAIIITGGVQYVSPPIKLAPQKVGIEVWLDVTAVPGIDTLTLFIFAYDPVFGFSLPKSISLLSSAPIVAVSTNRFQISPGAANLSIIMVPDFFFVITPSGPGTFTCSLSSRELD